MTVNNLFTLLFLMFLVLATLIVEARVKLSALPQRERVVIQLQHPNFAVVEEERLIPLLAGKNAVDFAWGNSGIDQSHFLFRLLDKNYPANIIAVSFPPNENALVWSVGAERAGSIPIRISYLMPSLQREFHYRATANPNETALSLTAYLRLFNRSTEGFTEAEINAGFGHSVARPIEQGETREFTLVQFDELPITKRYLADAVKIGYLDRAKDQLTIPMRYELRHENLGDAILPPGKVRIFLQDPQNTTAFIGEDRTAAVPPGDFLNLRLGLAQDVVVKRRILSRENRIIVGPLANLEAIVGYEIENFKTTPIELTITEHLKPLRAELGSYSGLEPSVSLGNQTTLGTPDPLQSDFETLTFRVTVPPKATDDPPVLHKVHLIFQQEW